MILSGEHVSRIMEMLEIMESEPFEMRQFQEDMAVDMSINELVMLHGESAALGGCARFLRKMIDKSWGKDDDVRTGYQDS